MSKVLSIEVGTSLTRICEMDYRSKSPKVYNSLSIPNPEGLVEDGFISENSDFVSTLKFALAENKIKTKQVIFSVTSSRIITREAVLPAMKEAQLDSLIRTNITDYLPVDPNNFELAHMVLGAIDEGEKKFQDNPENAEKPGKAEKAEKSTKNRVLILAADKKLVENYRTFAESCGLKMNCLDYSGNSVFQVMKDNCKENVELIVKVEEKSTVCTIIKNKNLMMQRNVPYGISGAIQAVMSNPMFQENTYEDALEALKGKTILRNIINEKTRVIESEDGPADTEKMRMARTEVTEALDVLIGNISRVMDLYNDKNPNDRILHASVIGLGSDISGLSKLFTNELGVRTSFVNTIPGLNFNKLAGEKGYGQYLATAGAAIAPVGFLSLEKKQTDMMNVNYRTATILCAVLFLIVCGYMIFSAKANLKSKEDRRDELKRKERTYTEGEKTYERLEKAKELYTGVLAGYMLTASNNDNLLAFLTELEQSLPETVSIERFSSDNDGVSMIILCPDVEEAAVVTETIRHFKSLMTVNVGSVTRVEKKDDEFMMGIAQGVVPEETENDEDGEETGEEETIYEYMVNLDGVYYPAMVGVYNDLLESDTETE